MSLMLRLLSLLAIASSALVASTDSKVLDYVKDQLSKNPKIEVDSVVLRESFELKEDKTWRMYIIDIQAKINQKGRMQAVKAQETLFSNGLFISADLIDIKKKQSLRASISPSFDAKFYTASNLVVGNATAKHKLAVFSDPLCPFCTQLVPQLIQAATKYPNEFALYLYHFPLGMHPAAKTIVKCMIAAEQKGFKDVVLKTYTVKENHFKSAETNEKKILTAFNKLLGSSLSMEDINDPKVIQHTLADRDIQTKMLVNSTPTLFFDGKKDANRAMFGQALKSVEK